MAAYDKYDYSKYWVGREYEHACEENVLQDFLTKIQIGKLAEVGSGYGRLVYLYLEKAKSVTLIDPSQKLISKSRELIKNPKIKYIKSSIEKIPHKKTYEAFDTIIMVRVLHHIDNTSKAMSEANRMLKKGGYFILEFPNKMHWKAILKNFMKGNFTYPLDIDRISVNGGKQRLKKSIPFYNFHPDKMAYLLQKNGFKVEEVRSVSNVRSPTLKKAISLKNLIFIEDCLQPFASKVYFGPSVFVLAKKVK